MTIKGIPKPEGIPADRQKKQKNKTKNKKGKCQLFCKNKKKYASMTIKGTPTPERSPQRTAMEVQPP